MRSSTRVFLIWLLGACPLFAQSPIDSVTLADLSRMNGQERLNFYRQFQPEQLANPNDYLAVLIEGVRDGDKAVRFEAVGKLSYAMIGLQQLKRQGQPVPVDFSKLPDLQAELSKAVADSDPEVRGAAISALVYSDAPNAQIENTLLTRISNEQNGQLRGAIIESLVFAGYESDRLNAAVLTALDDPDRATRENAVKAVATLKPPGALPKLATLLSNREMVRGFVVEAIAAYGAEARPYLPQLEAMLASGDAGGTLVDDLKKAIEAIKNPPPQAAATPRIKAVSLVDASSKPPTPTAAAQTTPAPTQQPKPGASPTPTVAAEKRPSPGFPVVPVAILAAVIVGAIVFLFRRKQAK